MAASWQFPQPLGRVIASGIAAGWSSGFISSGILGLPQSRPCENVQSVVTSRPTAPACRAADARPARRLPVDLEEAQGLAAMTSLDQHAANEDNLSVPRAAAARAAATSPPGSTA